MVIKFFHDGAKSFQDFQHPSKRRHQKISHGAKNQTQPILISILIRGLQNMSQANGIIHRCLKEIIQI